MIGKIYWSIFPFYNSKTGKNAYKKRPVLIISGPRNNDYTILPVSSISNKANLDTEYDVEVDPAKYPLLNLSKVCYVRTHKQTIVHRGALTSQISDLKTDYEELYLMVLEKLEGFNRHIMDEAL